jgi:hypothetical protein
MANPDHFEVLRQGVESWNAWWEAERFDNAVRAMFAISKEDIQKQDAKWKRPRTWRKRAKRSSGMLILTGFVAILLGTSRGVVEALQEGIQRFRSPQACYPKWRPSTSRSPGQIWFAVVGIVLILTGLLMIAGHD